MDLPNLRQGFTKNDRGAQALVATTGRESQGTRWHPINQAEFSERAARARNQKRGASELVASVTAGESFPRYNNIMHRH